MRVGGLAAVAREGQRPLNLDALPQLPLWLIPALPVVAAALAVLVPRDDRLTLRAIGMLGLGAAFAVAVLVVVAADADGADVGWGLRLRAPVVPALLGVLLVGPFSLRAGAPRVREGMAPFVVALVAEVAAVALALVIDDAAGAFAAATVAAVPGFALVALYGGPERGTVTWGAAALWLVVDGAALGLIIDGGRAPLPPELGATILLAPGLVRLAAGPLGLWALPLFEMAPVSAAVNKAAVSAPLGAVLLWRGAGIAETQHPGVVAAIIPTAAVVLAAAAAIGAALVVVERDLRRVAAHWLGILGSVSALVIVVVTAEAGGVVGAAAVGDAVGLVVVSGLAIAFLVMVTEAIERRLETRRVTNLAGLSAAAPMLSVLLPLSVLLIGGAPGPGTAPLLWPALSHLAQSSFGGVGGAAAVIAAAILVGIVGAAGVTARVVLPQRRKHLKFIRVSFMQGFRLLAPLTALILASLGAPALSALWGPK